ncbi:MAG: FMN-binding negative transcriptional regulator [Thalassovita sp.]
MHPNPAFRGASQADNLKFAADKGFGILAVGDADSMPLMAHLPFYIDGEDLFFHMVRSNPIARSLKTARPAKIAVSGTHSYLSPDWYGVDDQVPTWNYVAVHLSGQAEVLAQDQLRGVIDRLSDTFEERLEPKPIWKSTKMPDDALARMMRMIVPAKMRITDVQGTWKLAQHKPEAARLAAADHIETDGIGSELATMAALMRTLPEGA